MATSIAQNTRIIPIAPARAPQDSATTAHQHIASLDGLRAFSVLLVIISHTGFGALIPGGLGVTIFFFLSGYLITTLLRSENDQTGAINIRNFYVRRACRLLPPMLLALVIAYSLTLVGLLPGNITLEGLAAQLLYFANYYAIFFDHGNTLPAGTMILWSLAVEEHFYMIYPALMAILLARQLSSARIALLFCAVCLAVLAWRCHLVLAAGAPKVRTYFGTDTRIDSILFGCILALACNPVIPRHAGKQVAEIESKQRTTYQDQPLLIAALLLLAITLLIRNPIFHETLRYTLQGIALMPIFYYAVRHAMQFPFSLLNHPVLVKLGVYSYSLYLIHAVAIEFCIANIPGLVGHRMLLTFLVLAISLAFAALVDAFVDPYFRALGRRFRTAHLPPAKTSD